MRFSIMLKKLRKQKNITQQHLADYLKVTRSTIAGYETKGKQPDYERLLKIAAYFGVSVDYLLTGGEWIYRPENNPFSSNTLEVLKTSQQLTKESLERLSEYIELLSLKEQSTNKKKL